MLGNSKLIGTNKVSTIIHRLDPRCKILTVLAFSIVAVILDNPYSLLVIFIISLVAHLFAKTPFYKFKVLIIIISLGMWGAMFSQALFYSSYPRTILFVLIPKGIPLLGRITDGLYVYKEGFVYGMVQALRFSTTICLGLLMVWTTEPRELLVGLVKLRVPYPLSFMTITAVRFLPQLLAEVTTVISVQRLRGYKPLKIGLIKPVKTLIYTLKPVLTNLIHKSKTLSLSVESRGFNPSSERSYFHEIKFSWFDFLLICSIITSLITMVIIKLFYLLYTNEIFYSSNIRWLYEIAIRYL